MFAHAYEIEPGDRVRSNGAIVTVVDVRRIENTIKFVGVSGPRLSQSEVVIPFKAIVVIE